MKTKNIIIIVCCIILAAFTLGATGMIKVANDAAQEGPGSDRLIGVLITKEYLDLFDSDRFFNDNANKLMNGGEISEADSSKYQGCLYATLIETKETIETGESVTSKEYVFDGIECIRFFAPYINDELGSYWSTKIDEGITDVNTHFNSSDDGEGISLKGTIYVASGDNLGNFYFNPVYQTLKGDVYAVSGDGVFWGEGSEPGVSWSQKITENRTELSGDTKTSSGAEVEVTICVMEEPTSITLLQFNSKNELLEKTDFTPGNLPEHIDALHDAQYMIVETTSTDGISRTVFQREDDFVYAFYCRDDGICIKHGYEVNWSD
ncbi:MAG: hypothetical protein IKX16_00325 [Clostridia bacterium]|nr:hypothetical protein [Clostridia bacterium]